MMAHVMTGDLHHASFWGKIALEYDQAAVWLDGVLGRTHHFLAGRFPGFLGFNADRLAGYRHGIGV